jgi:hypothetical protein
VGPTRLQLPGPAFRKHYCATQSSWELTRVSRAFYQRCWGNAVSSAYFVDAAGDLRCEGDRNSAVLLASKLCCANALRRLSTTFTIDHRLHLCASSVYLVRFTSGFWAWSQVWQEPGQEPGGSSGTGEAVAWCLRKAGSSSLESEIARPALSIESR